MSDSMPSVTTSACSPSSTARDCAPEPPCEVFTVTTPPPGWVFQNAANRALTSL